MPVLNALAGIAVRDLDASVRWYEPFLGTASRPMPEVAEWSLAMGGGVQLFRDVARAGRSSVTFVVDDLAAHIGLLDALGVQHGAMSRSDAVDTLIVEDPDGNQVVFAHAKDDALVR